MASRSIAPGNSFRIGNMWKPEGFPIGLPYSFDFGAVAEYEIDIELDQTLHGLDFVQTIYVRNTDNANALVLTFVGGQVIDVPAGGSGYFPVAASWGKFNMKAATVIAAELIVDVLLINVPMTAQSWGPVTVNVAQVNATFTPVQKDCTSTQVTLTGASDQLLAANNARTRVIIQNSANNADPIAINFGAAAVLATGFLLFPGERYDSATGPVDPRAINAIGTAGDVVNVLEQ